MKSFCIDSLIKIYNSCEIDGLSSLCYNNGLCYCTSKSDCAIYVIDMKTTEVENVKCCRRYSVICYDNHANCFWCVSSDYKYIYQLDFCFNEIACIDICLYKKAYGKVCSMECENNDIILYFSCNIIKMTKFPPIDVKITQVESGLTCAVSFGCGRIECKSIASIQMIYGYDDCGKLKFMCSVPLCYKICGITKIHDKCNEYYILLSNDKNRYIIAHAGISNICSFADCKNRGCFQESCCKNACGNEKPLSCCESVCGAEKPLSCCESACGIENSLSCCESVCGAEKPLSCCEHDNCFDKPKHICQKQAATDIIQSIALEQTALSHILNAEGEKVQKAVANACNICDLLTVNESVQKTITKISNLEQVLLDKMEIAKEILYKDDCF